MEKVIKAQEGFADKACACNTIACVKKVQEEQNAWVAAYGHTVTGNDETVAQLEAANKRLSECILKVVEEVQGQ
ncbi:MAG: hypothetical protein QNK19_18285 [Xanthomonadales bacterium]|nr:hypothetical protein [Xanthomonadales bacterium]